MIDKKTALYSEWINQGFLLPEEYIHKKIIHKTILYMNKTISQSEIDIHNWHIRSKSILRLCRDQKILRYLKLILGKDINIWRSVLFLKPSQSKNSSIPWHQDNALWELTPHLTASVWLALDDVYENNGCIELIPGMHLLSRYAHNKKIGIKFNHQVNKLNPNLLQNAVKITRKKGQFLIFNENILHRSMANKSLTRRAALCFRYTIPSVKIINPLPALASVAGSDHYMFSKHWD